MPALSEYSNVYNTALAILREKGYDVWFDDAAEMFACQRDGWDFLADSPLALLGAAAIYDHVQPGEFKEYWWKRSGHLDYRTLPKDPPKYQPIWKA